MASTLKQERQRVGADGCPMADFYRISRSDPPNYFQDCSCRGIRSREQLQNHGSTVPPIYAVGERASGVDA